MSTSLRYKHSDLTKEIIGAFYEVYNALGFGFLEKVYENALMLELQQRGFKVQQQVPIKVFFKGQTVGEYFADLIVNDLIILELKAIKGLSQTNEAQLLNYLKATQYEVGLLLNFGPTATHKRRAFDNNRKPNLKKSGKS